MEESRLPRVPTTLGQRPVRRSVHIDDSVAVNHWVEGPFQSPESSIESKQRKPEKPRPGRPKTIYTGQRQQVIRNVVERGLKGQAYAHKLGEYLKPPPEWCKLGCPPTYREAYEDKHWRQRIFDERHKATHRK